MKVFGKIRIALIVAMMVFACGSADAQRWHRHHGHVAHTACMVPPTHVTVVSRPATTTHISNRLTQKERFEMARVYLKTHDTLTVKQYAKMTGLSKDVAKAELEVFMKKYR